MDDKGYLGVTLGWSEDAHIHACATKGHASAGVIASLKLPTQRLAKLIILAIASEGQDVLPRRSLLKLKGPELADGVVGTLGVEQVHLAVLVWVQQQEQALDLQRARAAARS